MPDSQPSDGTYVIHNGANVALAMNSAGAVSALGDLGAAAADALADVRGAMTAAPLSFAAAAAPYARAGSAALAPQAGEAGAGTSYVVNFNGATVNESSAIDARIEQFVVDLHRMGALYG